MNRVLRPSLALYARMARLGWPRSYAGKMLLVAFVGTHVPLIALLAYFILSVSPSTGYTLRIGGVALAATLFGTAATLLGLHRLLGPVLLTQRALRAYQAERVLPDLPADHRDEAGVLMADTQHALHQLDEALLRMAHYDAVTGLPNRALFSERAAHACAHARRDGHRVAALVLELERLPEIISSYGTAAGDVVVRAVAQRLGVSAREADVLARVGDSTFGVLDLAAGSTDGLLAQARRLQESLTLPVLVPGSGDGDIELRVGARVGIALFPGDAADAEHMLQRAQAAVHAAVRAGTTPEGDRVHFYSATAHEELQGRLALERDLRGAVSRGELFVLYQPKVTLATDTVASLEALVRWRHPVRGIVSPAEFIPVAEETGLIVEMGAWILREACMETRRWQKDGHAVRVAVNLSAQQVARTDVVAMVRDVLAETDLPAASLELEITESLLVADLSRATRVLSDLRELGVTIALDDFGTGYSSLSYLRNLPVDVVKIDGSFMHDLGHDRVGDAVVNAVLTLAQGLSLSVVAEGVETSEQHTYLRGRGCDVGQGYFFARPLHPSAVPALLEAGAMVRG